MSTPQIEYLPDAAVDPLLDENLRRLLCLCFTKPCDVVVFKERRYFDEPPSHRWLMRDETAMAIAHIAVHEKYVVVSKKHLIGGIAEVCVHPDHRNKGYVERILAEIVVSGCIVSFVSLSQSPVFRRASQAQSHPSWCNERYGDFGGDAKVCCC